MAYSLTTARQNTARSGFACNPTAFGRILRGELPAVILYEDQQILCFRDRAPVSDHHYLVIPKRLITDASALIPADLPLLRKMVDVATQVAEANGVADVPTARASGNLSLGFHRWPFITVQHLHLHLIWPHPARSCIKAWQHPAKNGRMYPSPEMIAEWYCGAKLN
mmetsp:Transcript_44422/g.92747  ORF Transcript_44422/g.92747 Transcript_44422/m.92747 type:complete len:166 (-) Transcript_44422:396-893(-)